MLPGDPPYDPALDPAAEPLPVMGVARSPKWAKVRAAHLAEHPECVACGARTMLEVHHVKPFHLFPELELDPQNLMTLCQCPGHNCHLMFGHSLNWAAYNPHAVTDAVVFRERVRTRRIA